MKVEQKSILENVKWRYAVKKFVSGQKIPSHIIEEILEGLRLTPSSFGLQPWKFLVITDEKTKKGLRPLSWNQSQIEDCSHLVVLCRKTSMKEKDVSVFVDSISEQRNKPLETYQGYYKVMVDFINGMNSSELEEWMSRQVYIALGNLMTHAAALCVDSCPIEGFSKTDYDRYLKLEEKNLKSVVVCALGYRSPEDKYQLEKKVRFSNAEIFEFI